MSICKYDYDWILDDLAVGNIVAGSNLDNLLNHGINVVICAIPTLPLPIEKYKQKGIILELIGTYSFMNILKFCFIFKV